MLASRIGLIISLIVLLYGCGRGQTASTGGEQKPENSTRTVASPGVMDEEQSSEMEVAIFGAGCFWGVEARFREQEGVTATAVGYCGGHVENPTYRQVCSKGTGHAEVVRVEFDPAVISYDDLLEVFWRNHDPTQLNRQGPDIGDQYRSVIFYTTPEQSESARASLAREGASGRHARPIVTQIEPAGDFWMAEEYHQQYLEKRGLSTCHPGL
jgi:peptide-methionine (S)-S-oxide reductase